MLRWNYIVLFTAGHGLEKCYESSTICLYPHCAEYLLQASYHCSQELSGKLGRLLGGKHQYHNKGVFIIAYRDDGI